MICPISLRLAFETKQCRNGNHQAYLKTIDAFSSFSFFFFYYLLPRTVMSNIPDYYAILDIPATATHDEIREGNNLLISSCQAFFKLFFHNIAYKKQALISHPDRLFTTATRAERDEATRKFQLVADAYYILGDRSRRDSYDKSRVKNQDRFTSSDSAMPNASTNQANQIFGNIFEELLKPEGNYLIEQVCFRGLPTKTTL
jgi:type I restriction-modification system DNA methylase subunit